MEAFINWLLHWPWWAWLLLVIDMGLGAWFVDSQLCGLWQDAINDWWRAFKDAPAKVGGLLDTVVLLTVIPTFVLLVWVLWLPAIIIMYVVVVIEDRRAKAVNSLWTH